MRKIVAPDRRARSMRPVAAWFGYFCVMKQIGILVTNVSHSANVRLLSWFPCVWISVFGTHPRIFSASCGHDLSGHIKL